MAFNHYAMMKRILQDEPDCWYIKQVNKPTEPKTFKGEIKKFDHYYRIYDNHNQPIKYCKFQQLDRFCSIMNVTPDSLPLVN